MGLEGRVALITGGSRGIGRAIGIALAEAGADIAINYLSDEQAAREVVEHIEKVGRRTSAYKADVGDLEQVESMAESVLKEFGFVDILVNNAFATPSVSSLLRMPIADVERQLRVSALGPARLTQILLPYMRDRRRGDVVMISSVGTKYFGPYAASYHMGKSAMEALALSVAREERSHGVRVNVVRPGLIYTDTGAVIGSFLGAQDVADLDRRSPTGHVGRPEDVASVVTFLVSEHGWFVSGQPVDVDGGGGLETQIDSWLDQGEKDLSAAFRRLPERQPGE